MAFLSLSPLLPYQPSSYSSSSPSASSSYSSAGNQLVIHRSSISRFGLHCSARAIRSERRRRGQVVRMAPEEEKMTRRSPLDFPINLYSAYNGIAYLYVKGYGVDEKNYTIAKELFEKAAAKEDPGGYYNLGVLYLKGIGVKRDVKLACKYFLVAANTGQPKAFYQLAKMFETGIGLKKNLQTATTLYKLVAERGPWSLLSRWALESYLKGDVGKEFHLYSRMAELGYELAQSNAAWILDKYGEPSGAS